MRRGLLAPILLLVLGVVITLGSCIHVPKPTVLHVPEGSLGRLILTEKSNRFSTLLESVVVVDVIEYIEGDPLGGHIIHGSFTATAIKSTDIYSDYLTVAHGCQVIKHGPNREIEIEDSHNDFKPAVVVKVDALNDLCIIRSALRKKPVPIAFNYKYLFGDDIYTVGSPLGLFPFLSEGHVVEQVSDNMGSMSMVVSEGFSGSPVVHDGAIIGVVVAYLPAVPNLSLFVPLSAIESFLNEVYPPKSEAKKPARPA